MTLEPDTIAGVVLAGGLSRRMGGGDKGLIDLAGTSMIGRVIDRIAPQVAHIAINANGPKERFAAFGLPVIADPIPDHPGPLAGVLAGLRWARSLGEFGPLLIFAGVTRMKTEVLSTSVFLEMNIGDIEAAVAVSLIMVAAAAIVLTITRLWGARDLAL